MELLDKSRSMSRHSLRSCSQKSSKSSKGKRHRSDGFFDEDGNYLAEPGESLCSGRYEVISFLGQGAFGSVLHCWDRKRKFECAVKIIRDNEKYKEDAQYEIDVLDDIRDADRDGSSRCVELWNVFHLGNQLCMVFEPLGKSLYDVLKSNRHASYPIDAIRTIAFQCLESLKFLRDMNLVHTDLKPENILFEETKMVKLTHHGRSIYMPQRYDVKVIDFGNAIYADEISSSKVCTRHYRPPEVILDADWSTPCDMWSLGCILVELFTGEMLFDTHNSIEHLALIERVAGPFPASLLSKSRSKRANHFTEGLFSWNDREATQESLDKIRSMKSLQEIVPPRSEQTGALADLLGQMLTVDPAARITPREALRHPFFVPLGKDTN